MTETAFPWPWRGPENRRLSVVVGIFILAVNAWALFAIDILPIPRKSAWDPQANLRAPLFARFDSGWYDSIIRYGYQRPPTEGGQSAHSFFPVYPTAGRFVHLLTGIDSFQSGLLVTWIALFLAVPLLVEEARERFGEKRARDALPFLFLYPVAFFLTAVYTETTFLLIVLLAFRAVRRGELPMALLFGVLVGLTRAPGAAVGPALAIAWAAGRRDDPRRWAGAAFLLFAPVAGVLGWIFGIGIGKGETLLFFRSMGAWREAAGNPFDGLIHFVREPIALFRSGLFASQPWSLAPWLHLALFGLLGAYQARQRMWAGAAWTACALGLSIATGTAAGIPRYTLTIYPGHFAAARMCEGRPALRRVWLGLYAALLLLNAALFTNWHFVS